MPSVIVETDDNTAFVEPSFVVVTKCKERKIPLVSGVVSVDADYTRVWFAEEDRLFFEV
jgi:hypothetical protein